MYKKATQYNIVYGFEEREMTQEEAIQYIKSKVEGFDVNTLHTIDQIFEYLHMVKQLRGEVPIESYYIGSQRLEAHDAAEQVVCLDNFNEILKLTDEDLFDRVADFYLEFAGCDYPFETFRRDKILTKYERYYLQEGIEIAKDFLDFENVDSIIDKYNWANVTGDELYDIVIKAQKKLLKNWTKSLEELVTAGARILTTEYGVYFHHTENLTLREYVDRAKKFRRENWDFDID